MINTAIDPFLEKFMPHPKRNLEGDSFGCEVRLSMELFEQSHRDDYVQHAWTQIYRQAVEAVTDVIMGRQEYFVVRYIPEVIRGHFTSWDDEVKLRVRYEIMVCATKNAVIPTFTYSSDVSNKAIEWRCGYCASPNDMLEKHCKKCGAPRALLIQEMSNND